MLRKSFHITARQAEELGRQTRETGLAQAEIVRRALDEYFGRHPLIALPSGAIDIVPLDDFEERAE